MLRKIRQVNIVVVMLLLLQLTVYPANTLGIEKPSISAEQAVQVVKDNFSIPEKFPRLSTGYSEYNNRATYSLNWNSDQPPGGSFHAEVDANTGDILNVNQWEQPLKPSFRLPVLSAGDAEKIATDLFSKLASKHQSEMQLVKDSQQVFTLNNDQPFTYNFRWIRMVNGIPFPGNGVNVSVSGDDGRPINYNYNWTQGLDFPAVSKVISPEKARQVFSDTPMLELRYFIPPIMDPQAPEPQRVLLVYQLTNKYYGGAVDALSGKPVTLEPTGGVISPAGSASVTKLITSSAVVSTEAVSPIKEASTKQDTPAKSQQISQSEAAGIVKKMITIPKGLVLQHSSLNPDWQNPSEQVWDLQWNSPSYNSGEHRYLSARVNAKDGDVISFNQSNQTNSNNTTKPITRKAAQKIADDFLERIQPERFKLVKVESENFYGGKMPSNVESFNYVRVVNGIPVSSNGMNISIDTLNKKVNHYNLNWSNVEFPASSDVITLNQATERFLQTRPLVLNYTLIYQQNDQQEVRLVYQPNSESNIYLPAMLDAKSGDPMDWYGKSQSQWFKSHNYTDIQGNYAEREIGIMGLTGAFGEYGDTFRPDEKVTTGSLLRAILTAEGTNRERVLSDEDVLKIAKERRWIQEEMDLGSQLSREGLSKIMIRLINMEPSAQVEGIYTVPFTDAKTIQSDSLGYIALAWGLGILKIDQNTLHLNQTVTRAEAAYALVHAYTVERSVFFQ